MNKSNLICFMILFILSFVTLNATTDLFRIKTLHGDIDLSTLYSMWNPSLQYTDGNDRFINSKTLGEASLNIKGHLEYLNQSLFKIDYLIPLINTPDMKQIIDYNSKEETGIEKLKFYFIIDPVANMIFSGDNLKYLRFITQIKFEYQRRRFITSAKNNSSFFYIPENAVYNSYTESIDGIEQIYPDTKMIWNTVIIEQEITLKILETVWDKLVSTTVNGKKVNLLVPVQIRLGYFTCTQKQPAAGIFSYDNVPTIMDVNLKANGLVAKIVTINEEAPGLNVDMHAKWAGSKINSAAFDLYKDKFDSKAESNYIALGFDIWYNIRFNSKCLLTLGSDNEINAFIVDIPTDEDDDDGIRWRLRQWPTDFYLRFGYRF